MRQLAGLLFLCTVLQGCAENTERGSSEYDSTSDLNVDSASGSAKDTGSASAVVGSTDANTVVDTMTQATATTDSGSDNGASVDTSVDTTMSDTIGIDSSSITDATIDSQHLQDSTFGSDDSATGSPPVLNGLGVPCADGTTCISGNCVDGVCCETACDDVCVTCGVDGLCNVVPDDDTDCPTITCPDEANECMINVTPVCVSLGECATEEDCVSIPVPASALKTCGGSENRICSGDAGCVAAPTCRGGAGYCLEGTCCINGVTSYQICGNCPPNEDVLSLQCQNRNDCGADEYCVFEGAVVDDHQRTFCSDSRFLEDPEVMATCASDTDCDVSQRCEEVTTLWSAQLPRLCSHPVVECGDFSCNTGLCCATNFNTPSADDDVFSCGDTDFECDGDAENSLRIECRSHRDCPQNQFCNYLVGLQGAPGMLACEESRADASTGRTVCEFDSDCAEDSDPESCILTTGNEANFIYGTCDPI